MLSLSEPILGDAEKKAVLDVLDGGWITMGEKVKQFESDFAKIHGFDDAVAVNSCTSGLHVALVALGIGEGDEVLVPSLTFVATINAIRYVGATPVFVDIEALNEPHISLEKAKKKVTDKTAAVMVMHYGGYLCDMPAWRDFADEFNIKLIEDAAHSPLCEGVAEHGDVTSFSFFSNKNMTTSEGGMLFAHSDEMLDKMRNLRSHGMTSVTLDRHKGHAYSYDVTNLGFNYRLDEIRASIGIEQVKKLAGWNAKRKQNSDVYRRLLAENKVGIELPFDESKVTVGHLMPVLLPKGLRRESVMDALREGGVQSSIHYPPAHKFTHYQNLYPDIVLAMTEEYCSRELSLPLHPELSESEIQKVCQNLIEACS